MSDQGLKKFGIQVRSEVGFYYYIEAPSLDIAKKLAIKAVTQEIYSTERQQEYLLEVLAHRPSIVEVKVEGEDVSHGEWDAETFNEGYWDNEEFTSKSYAELVEMFPDIIVNRHEPLFFQTSEGLFSMIPAHLSDVVISD